MVHFIQLNGVPGKCRAETIPAEPDPDYAGEGIEHSPPSVGPATWLPIMATLNLLRRLYHHAHPSVCTVSACFGVCACTRPKGSHPYCVYPPLFRRRMGPGASR